MSDDQVNKIISEFMGIKPFIVDNETLYDIPCLSCAGHDEYGTTYTRSLDALVPVWDKLDRITDLWYSFNTKPDKSFIFGISIEKEDKFYDPPVLCNSTNKTIQQAAAHATAKTILELNRQNLP